MTTIRSLLASAFSLSVASLGLWALVPHLWGKDMAPLTGTPKVCEEEVRRLFDLAVAASPPSSNGTAAKPEWKLNYTTWLPNEWPPTTATIWTRYAYGLDVALDGASGVSAPIARLERPVGTAKVFKVVSMAGKLERIGTHAVRPHKGWRYTLDDEENVLSRALALTGEPPEGARGTIGLLSYFKSWRMGNAEIAKHVRSRHKAFFKWLDSLPAD